MDEKHMREVCTIETRRACFEFLGALAIPRMEAGTESWRA